MTAAQSMRRQGHAGTAGNKPRRLYPNTRPEIRKFTNWANQKVVNGTAKNEFGPKNNDWPGNWMRSNPIQ